MPPDDGLQICPKHLEVGWRNKLRINSASSWFLLRNYVLFLISIFLPIIPFTSPSTAPCFSYCSRNLLLTFSLINSKVFEKCMKYFYYFVMEITIQGEHLGFESCLQIISFFLFIDAINTLRTGSFKLFKRPFPGFLTILTL